MDRKPFKPSGKHNKILNIFINTGEDTLRTDQIRAVYKDTTETVRGLLSTLEKHGYIKSKLHSGLMRGCSTMSRFRIGKYRAWSITPKGKRMELADENVLCQEQVQGHT